LRAESNALPGLGDEFALNKAIDNDKNAKSDDSD